MRNNMEQIKQNIELDPKSLRILAIIGVAVLIIVYALSTVAKFTISPEIGMAFLTFGDINNIFQIWHKFLVFNEIWYRPFTFYLTNYAIFNLIDIHNIYLFKTIGLGLILINGLVVSALSKTLFASGLIERIFIFSLVVTHPLYYFIAYDGSGIVDPVFTIFLNFFIICFIRLLAPVSNTSTMIMIYKTQHKIVLTILCCVLTLCTITSHERGLAIFPITGALYLYYYHKQIVSRTRRFDSATTCVLVFSGVVFALYMYFVYGSKQGWTGPDYRTGFELTYILPNLVKAIELPFRFIFYNTGKDYDVHKEWGFNLLALPFAIALISYLICIFRGTNSQEKSRLVILAILFLLSLPLPVLFGGNIWHFYTAALYVSIVTGRALWFWCQKIETHFQGCLLVIFFIWLSLATVRGVHQELEETGLGDFMKLVPEALTDNTLRKAPFVPEVVYYDTGSYGDFTWPFGGKGNLFKFIYKNPQIIEIALLHGKVLETDRPLCKQVAGKKTLAYGFNVQNLSWHKIQENDYCA